MKYESDPEEAYLDRNLCVQTMVRMASELGYKTGIRDDGNWSIFYIDLPTGQVSWHIPKLDIVGMFPEYLDKWDGHDVDTKRYGRSVAMIYPIRKYLICSKRWKEMMNKYINNLFADLGIFMPVFVLLTILAIFTSSGFILSIDLLFITIISLISNFYYAIALKKTENKEAILMHISSLEHYDSALYVYIYMGMLFMVVYGLIIGSSIDHFNYGLSIFFISSFVLPFFFVIFYVLSWMETKGEVNISLIPLVKKTYPYSYKASEESFSNQRIFIVSKELVRNNIDCKMYNVDENGRNVFLFGYRTYKTK